MNLLQLFERKKPEMDHRQKMRSLKTNAMRCSRDLKRDRTGLERIERSLV